MPKEVFNYPITKLLNYKIHYAIACYYHLGNRKA
jgi:hypothetical protein